MRTSNKLVILITVVFFGTIIASAMILKKEYYLIEEGISDPFYGLVRNELSAFSAVKLEGNYHGLVEIRPGEKHEILHTTSLDIFEWEVRQDTLFLSYTGEAKGGRYFSEQTLRRPSAAAYILAPSISFLASQGMSCRVSEIITDNFQARFSGAAGGMSFKENTFRELSAQAVDNGLLQIEYDNRIDKAFISAEDKSRVTIIGQEIDSLHLFTEPQAKVQLPGALLEKLKR